MNRAPTGSLDGWPLPIRPVRWIASLSPLGSSLSVGWEPATVGGQTARWWPGIRTGRDESRPYGFPRRLASPRLSGRDSLRPRPSRTIAPPSPLGSSLSVGWEPATVRDQTTRWRRGIRTGRDESRPYGLPLPFVRVRFIAPPSSGRPRRLASPNPCGCGGSRPCPSRWIAFSIALRLIRGGGRDSSSYGRDSSRPYGCPLPFVRARWIATPSIPMDCVFRRALAHPRRRWVRWIAPPSIAIHRAPVSARLVALGRMGAGDRRGPDGALAAGHKNRAR